ncbi:TrkA C-terminal domain-containing protein [Natrinema sp. SYSU A 869]|uniref:TrkA C-terminal domain-containing protein n=1 Tax=Natrinema sp. SYSU A 869 TaxID=2871694 RepID=UPI001CA3F220|nr:TrkA C-terminal domain-containing protein [Natrinema sp. SYSU A 869]
MTGPIVLQSIVTEWTETALINSLGFAVLAGVVATGIAFGYRGYSTRGSPVGVGIFAGIAVVAGWLNLVGLEHATSIGDVPLVHHATAAYFLGAIAVSAVAAEGGRRIGDQFAHDVFDIDRVAATGDVASLVRSARQPTPIELPDEIGDIDGYPPVDASVKRELAGRTVLVPQYRNDSALRSRLSTRLERDYDVDHASIAIDSDGTIDRLAVGRRRAGIGAMLPSGTAAVAIRGDPSPTASAGDPIEVWTTAGDSSRLVTTGTLRATAGNIATITVSADTVDEFAFDPEPTYRLTTRSDPPDDGYGFMSVLRAADETVRSVTVREDGSLDNEFVDWLSGTVLVVVRDDEVIPFPDGNETLRAGDRLSVLGTPSELDSLSANEERAPR